MFQNFWSYALALTLSIAPVIFMAKVLWASHTMAMGGSIRKIITYVVGFAVAAVASITILIWAFSQGLPLVADLFANNPATMAVNDAGLQLAAMADAGEFTMPSLPGSDGATGWTMPSLPPAAGIMGNSAAGAPPINAAPTAAPAVTPDVQTMTVRDAAINNDHDWASYTVRPGDSMGSIARRYGISLGDLCGMNVATTRNNCNLIRPGMTLKLPASNGQTPREQVQVARPVVQMVKHTPVVIQPTTAPAVRQAVAAGVQGYTIQAGDTIYSIAGQFGGMGKVYGICSANRAVLGDNCDNLQAGATIVIK